MLTIVSRIVHKAVSFRVRRRTIHSDATLPRTEPADLTNTPMKNTRARARVVLLSLPGEILINILNLCDVADLFACSQVCRELDYLIRIELPLRYKILLAINGMVDGPPGPLSLSERFHRLRVYSVRCRSGPDAFSSTSSESYRSSWSPPAQGDHGWEVQLSFAGCTSYIVIKRSQHAFEVYAPPLGFAWDSILYHQTIPLALFPEGIVATASVDLSQDLLVVFVDPGLGGHLLVHLRRLSHPQLLHPHTISPMFRITRSRSSFADVRPPEVSSIQIHQHYIAWLLSSADVSLCSLEVWDWKQGMRIWHKRVGRCASFTLLDAKHVIVTSSSWAELRVYQFQQPPGSSAPPKHHILKLGLPSDINDCRIQESSIPSPPPDVEFWPDPSLRIITVTFDHSPPVTRRKRGRGGVLIPYGTLKFFIEEAAKDSPISMILHNQISWKVWGLHGSLLVSVPITCVHWDLRNSYSFGSRIPIHSPSTGSIAVFDLNPWAARFVRNPHMRSTHWAQLAELPDPKPFFGTEKAKVEHAVHYFSRVVAGHGNTLIMGHDGFSTVRNFSNGYLTVTSYFVRGDPEWPRGRYMHGSPINNRNDRALVRWSV